MKTFKKTLLAVAAVAVTAFAPLTASAALTWTYNWAGADALDGPSPDGRARSLPTDEAKFTAESVLRFTSGTPFTAGARFEDFIVLRFDQLFIGGNNNFEPGYGSVREITLTARLTGTQLTANTYRVNSGGLLNFYYDSGAAQGANGNTPGIFSRALFNTISLSSFNDGRLIETGTVVQPSGGLNSNSVPDGTIDVTALLNDNIVPGGFERDVNGNPFAVTMKLGLFDANNALCTDSGGTASCFSNTATLLALFGAAPVAGDLHTRSDGSMTKNAIPEPSSLALLGVSLLGMGAAARRRKS